MNIQEKVEAYLGKPVAQASNKEIYDGLLTVVQRWQQRKSDRQQEEALLHFSRVLIGKLLSNNMINLGIYQEVKEMLEKNGKDICEIEEAEPEPSLGNGGLGRLAACSSIPLPHSDLPGTESAELPPRSVQAGV